MQFFEDQFVGEPGDWGFLEGRGGGGVVDYLGVLGV